MLWVTEWSVPVAKSATRRSVLRSGFALAGLQAASGVPLLSVANGARRSVVCIYLLGGNHSAAMLAPAGSSGSPGFHPALREVRELFAAGVLAVAANVGDSTHGPQGPRRTYDAALSYLPNGYFTLGWAAAMAGSRLKDAAFTGFPDARREAGANMSLVAPRGSSRDQLAWHVAAAGRDTLPFRFPATSLGHQLQQVARVLASGLEGGVYVCPVTALAVSGARAARETSRLRELSSAMAAFHAATRSLGLAASVTTFTASEFHRVAQAPGAKRQAPPPGGYELALGGSLAGGRIFGAGDGIAPGASRERYLATMAAWFGMPRAELARHFRSLDSTAAPTLEFPVQSI